MRTRLLISLVALVAAFGLLMYAAFGPTGPSPSSSGANNRITTSTDNQPKPPDSERPPLVDEPSATPEGMAWIPGGSFVMGDADGAPDKDPKHLADIPQHRDSLVEHEVVLDGFWMDVTEVTNEQYMEFADATGYVTVAEKAPKREDFIGLVENVNTIPDENLVAGSICFNPAFDLTTLRKDHPSWPMQIWKYEKGANWRHPEGPKSSIADRMQHPVVHISWDDAAAYCKWAGKRLPSEAEWECAARGGLAGKNYPWGDEFQPGDKWLHNIYHGVFPYKDRGDDGFVGTAPVKSFPPNGYGLFDMTGNVWEWCDDWYRPDYYVHSVRRNPPGPRDSFDPQEPRVPKHVQRGGSFMCSDTYCIGYSVHSRMKGDPMSGAFHTGFRCVVPAAEIEKHQQVTAQN
jgi:formylglycine-generating enzyme required for sulfatase activity